MSESNNGKRPGGRYGNLNAAKSAQPALKRLETNKPLPPYLERVTALSEREAAELISDKGGKANMSGAECLLVSTWKSARMCELLIWHFLLKTNSPVQLSKDKSTWDLQPGMQRLSVFLAEQRRCLMALGLERRSRNVMDLKDYVAENYGGETGS